MKLKVLKRKKKKENTKESQVVEMDSIPFHLGGAKPEPDVESIKLHSRGGGGGGE